MIQARRGIWQFNVKKVQLWHGMTYVATQVSNGLITYILFTVIFSFVLLMLVWSATRDAVVWGILAFWPTPLLQLILVAVIPILLKLVCKKYFGPGQVAPEEYCGIAPALHAHGLPEVSLLP